MPNIGEKQYIKRPNRMYDKICFNIFKEILENWTKNPDMSMYQKC